MNKELEIKVHQMSKSHCIATKTLTPALTQFHYEQGISDADAVGFAKFYMEFNSELEEGNLSVEEAYLQYLNRK